MPFAYCVSFENRPIATFLLIVFTVEDVFSVLAVSTVSVFLCAKTALLISSARNKNNSFFMSCVVFL